ncbi:ATP-binding protein [Streptomyces sp. GC420]|nr:ATP-binding protein [Streptomyces sp. GC420]
MRRERWELALAAEAKEVSAVRRQTRARLTQWGLPGLVDRALLCVSELITNVVTHVGCGTPVTISLCMKGTHVRIEVRDPDTRALPTLLASGDEAESGRGLAILDAVSERWGVVLGEDTKTTWCELRTGLTSPTGHTGGAPVDRAEVLIRIYGEEAVPRPEPRAQWSLALAEGAAIDIIADLLHWLRAHGCCPEEALGRAWMHLEAEDPTA